MTSDDVRARRAERVREQKMRDMPKVVAKNVGIGLAVLVAVGGLAAAIWWSTSGQPNDVHWHAAWELYAYDRAFAESGSRPAYCGADSVNGYCHVDFWDRRYDLNRQGSAASYHLHTEGAPGDDNIVHLEFQAPPFPVSRFFRGVGVDMERNSVQLDAAHAGKTFANNETHKWRLFVMHEGGGPWDLVGRFEDYRMRDGDRLLVTFGDPDEMDVSGGETERQLATVSRNFGGGYEDKEWGPDQLPADMAREAPPEGNDTDNGTAEARRD